MKFWKRTVSMLLVLLSLIGIIPTAALATAPDVPVDNRDAIDLATEKPTATTTPALTSAPTATTSPADGEPSATDDPLLTIDPITVKPTTIDPITIDPINDDPTIGNDPVADGDSTTDGDPTATPTDLLDPDMLESAESDAPPASGTINWTTYGRQGHSSAVGDTVSFRGHPMVPFVSLLYNAATDGDYRFLTFHLTEGVSDWHTRAATR